MRYWNGYQWREHPFGEGHGMSGPFDTVEGPPWREPEVITEEQAREILTLTGIAVLDDPDYSDFREEIGAASVDLIRSVAREGAVVPCTIEYRPEDDGAGLPGPEVEGE